jgi:hypothetical protein
MRNNINKPRAATPNTGATAPMWNTDDLARAIGYHVESVRRCVRQGRIRTVRFGRFHRIPDVEAQRIFAQGLPL